MKRDRAAYQKAWRAANPEKRRMAARAYHAANKGRRRSYYLKCVYGISSEEYNALLQVQNGRCAVCKTDDPTSARRKHFDVDHCHDTGKVRGLLCHHCNVLLGNAKDDPAVLRAAASYLEKWGR